MERLELGSKRTVVLAPHPDDESIWCGGLLLKYRPDVVVLTDGRYGGEDRRVEETIRIRHKELAVAMRLAGVTSYCELGIEDGRLAEADFGKIARKVKLEDYDVIICPSPRDSHLDHACVWKLLKPFVRDGQEVFFYDGWSALAMPTHYLDVSDVIEAKRALVQTYSSQEAYVRYSERAAALNYYRGLLAYPAVDYAEAYARIQ